MSCSQFKGGDDIPEYVRYTITGTIKNEAETELAGVKLSVVSPEGHEYTAVASNDKGEYTIHQYPVNLYVGDVVVEFKEAEVTLPGDNPIKKKYAGQTKTVTLTRSDYTGGDGYYYLGMAKKTLDFVLIEVAGEGE